MQELIYTSQVSLMR